MSVMGSALAMAFSIHFGFQVTLVIATGIYALGAFFLFREFRGQESPALAEEAVLAQ
jgi:hypothetical protein